MHSSRKARAVKIEDQNTREPFLRADLATLKLPFFPEERGLHEYVTEVDGKRVRIFAEPGGTIATAADRRVLNILFGRLAQDAQDGKELSRYIEMDTRDALNLLNDEIGGQDYARIKERFTRLMGTFIETEEPLSGAKGRSEIFRWIDGLQADYEDGASGRKVHRLRITLSEQAYEWIVTSLGFNIDRDEFRRWTRPRSPVWRTFEVCLATLAESGKPVVRISLLELMERVPSTSEPKLFKSRALKSCFEKANSMNDDERRIELALEIQNARGRFEEVPFSKRAEPSAVFVRVTQGPARLPDINRIIEREDLRMIG